LQEQIGEFGVPLACLAVCSAVMAAIKPLPRCDRNLNLPRASAIALRLMSSDEARAIAAGNPLSFLHVSKPEIDLPRARTLMPGSLCEGRGKFQKLIKTAR